MQKELTDEALNKEFTIKMKRKDILLLSNICKQQNYKLNDAAQVLDTLSLFNSALALTEKDFKPNPSTPQMISKEELTIN